MEFDNPIVCVWKPEEWESLCYVSLLSANAWESDVLWGGLWEPILGSGCSKTRMLPSQNRERCYPNSRRDSSLICPFPIFFFFWLYSNRSLIDWIISANSGEGDHFYTVYCLEGKPLLERLTPTHLGFYFPAIWAPFNWLKLTHKVTITVCDYKAEFISPPLDDLSWEMKEWSKWVRWTFSLKNWRGQKCWLNQLKFIIPDFKSCFEGSLSFYGSLLQ